MPPPATTISCLCAAVSHILLEMFLRLPALVIPQRCARLACRPWLRAVRSLPAFRRRFRDLNLPPILWAFLDADGSAVPSFDAAIHSALDLATVLRSDREFWVGSLWNGGGGPFLDLGTHHRLPRRPPPPLQPGRQGHRQMVPFTGFFSMECVNYKAGESNKDGSFCILYAYEVVATHKTVPQEQI